MCMYSGDETADDDITSGIVPDDDRWTDDELPECPMCGGPLIPLGVLSVFSWYRCRNCGAECSGFEPAET